MGIGRAEGKRKQRHFGWVVCKKKARGGTTLTRVYVVSLGWAFVVSRAGRWTCCKSPGFMGKDRGREPKRETWQHSHESNINLNIKTSRSETNPYITTLCRRRRVTLACTQVPPALWATPHALSSERHPLDMRACSLLDYSAPSQPRAAPLHMILPLRVRSAVSVTRWTCWCRPAPSRPSMRWRPSSTRAHRARCRSPPPRHAAPATRRPSPRR